MNKLLNRILALFVVPPAERDEVRAIKAEISALRDEVAALKESKSDPDEDEHGQFLECDECRAKPGSPLLCGDCFKRRAEWSKRKRAASLDSGKTMGDDRLLKIAALFNKWANAGPNDKGPRNGWTAQKVLNQIGEVLGDPFAREPNAESDKEELRPWLPAEALTILHDLYQVLWCEAFYDPTNEETQKFARPISVKMTRLNELLRFKP